MVPPLTEGHQTTLTCTAPGLCSGSVPEITWTWRGAGVQDSHITGNITDFKTETLTAVTQRHSSTVTFDPSAEHHGTEVTCKVKFTGNITTEETVTLNVTYVKEVKIRGNTNVKEGETLRLICSVESFPPPEIKWTKSCHNKKLQNRGDGSLQSERGTATLIISSMRTEDAGQYMCTVQHLNGTLTGAAEVTVSATAVLPWVIAGMSLSINVFCLIYILYLWNTRQKAEPHHEDRTYISLKKTDRSQEYDIIVRPLK
ncbi:hypothetical protein Q5P01_011596 [Channa striata]|uniref:Ig-like domain-containing protein n=1 Tax=Channa striata TaxID=64152 RepID=A0AA88MZQ4_CHASR|nr:hypothetical protein Q5P01_011596 [Channa striata]